EPSRPPSASRTAKICWVGAMLYRGASSGIPPRSNSSTTLLGRWRVKRPHILQLLVTRSAIGCAAAGLEVISPTRSGSSVANSLVAAEAAPQPLELLHPAALLGKGEHAVDQVYRVGCGRLGRLRCEAMSADAGAAVLALSGGFPARLLSRLSR